MNSTDAEESHNDFEELNQKNNFIKFVENFNVLNLKPHNKKDAGSSLEWIKMRKVNRDLDPQIQTKSPNFGFVDELNLTEKKSKNIWKEIYNHIRANSKYEKLNDLITQLAAEKSRAFNQNFKPRWNLVKRTTKNGTRTFQYEISKDRKKDEFGKQRKLPTNQITGVIGQKASNQEFENIYLVLENMWLQNNQNRKDIQELKKTFKPFEQKNVLDLCNFLKTDGEITESFRKKILNQQKLATPKILPKVGKGGRKATLAHQRFRDTIFLSELSFKEQNTNFIKQNQQRYGCTSYQNDQQENASKVQDKITQRRKKTRVSQSNISIKTGGSYIGKSSQIDTKLDFNKSAIQICENGGRSLNSTMDRYSTRSTYLKKVMTGFENRSVDEQKSIYSAQQASARLLKIFDKENNITKLQTTFDHDDDLRKTRNFLQSNMNKYKSDYHSIDNQWGQNKYKMDKSSRCITQVDNSENLQSITHYNNVNHRYNSNTLSQIKSKNNHRYIKSVLKSTKNRPVLRSQVQQRTSDSIINIQFK